MRPGRARRGVQRLREQRSRRVAIGRQLGEGPENRLFDRVGNRGPHDRRRRHHVQRVAREHRVRGRPREGRLAHQHLVHDARQAVLVAAAVDVVAARPLLRAHVGGRPDDGARLGDMARVSRGVDGARDAEVRHHGRPARQHDVFRLDVAVHDPMAVRVRQRARHLRRDAQRIFLGELRLARQPIAQRFALHVRHDVIKEAGGDARVVQGQDVRMLQSRRDLDLAQEPLGAEGGRQLRVQQLDRDGPVVLQVLGQEHGGHAAAPQFPLHRIAVGEGLTQGVEQVGHGMWASLQSRPRRRQRRSCPAARRTPSYRPRMTNSPPALPGLWARSWRLFRAPSISQLFGAAFIVIAVAGLADRIAVWRGARRTQAAMIDLSQRLEQLDRLSPSPALRARIADMQELTADVGDEAIQLAVQSTVIFVVMLIVLGVGLWYNRRRLATPFAHVVGALERVAAGHYAERLREDEPEEFGTIARGVNRMAAALAWRERIQAHTARLLTALNVAPQESGPGGSFGAALAVLADATGATALALYQPSYDTNEWAPTGMHRTIARPLARDVVRQLVGEATTVIQHDGAAAGNVRVRLQLSQEATPDAASAALVPLRAGERLVRLLAVVVAGALTAEARPAL